MVVAIQYGKMVQAQIHPAVQKSRPSEPSRPALPVLFCFLTSIYHHLTYCVVSVCLLHQNVSSIKVGIFVLIPVLNVTHKMLG